MYHFVKINQHITQTKYEASKLFHYQVETLRHIGSKLKLSQYDCETLKCVLLKLKLLNSTFLWFCLFFNNLQVEISIFTSQLHQSSGKMIMNMSLKLVQSLS